MNVWSTEHVAPRERFSFWSDAVCAAFLEVTTHRDEGAPFRGSLRSTPVGELLINSIESAPYDVEHRGRPCLVADPQWLFVNLHHAGRCQLSQAGRVHAIQGCGEFSLNAGTQRFNLEFLEPIRLTCFRLPYAAVAARVPNLGDFLARPLPDTAATRLFSGYVAALTANATELTRAAASCASETFRDLLTLAIAVQSQNQEDARRSARRELYRQCCARLRFRLGDSWFDLQQLSASAHLATRTLQSLFRENGTTFTATLLEERLLAARQRLSQGGGRVSVTQTAYSVGFSDLSYFSRAFRRRFGISPSECREMT